MTKPSVQLAERIIQRLQAEQLVLPADAARTQGRLIDGKLGGEDWRLALEKALDAAQRAEDGAS